jgi:hypothetical protein
MAKYGPNNEKQSKYMSVRKAASKIKTKQNQKQ